MTDKQNKYKVQYLVYRLKNKLISSSITAQNQLFKNLLKNKQILLFTQKQCKYFQKLSYTDTYLYFIDAKDILYFLKIKRQYYEKISSLIQRIQIDDEQTITESAGQVLNPYSESNKGQNKNTLIETLKKNLKNQKNFPQYFVQVDILFNLTKTSKKTIDPQFKFLFEEQQKCIQKISDFYGHKLRDIISYPQGMNKKLSFTPQNYMLPKKEKQQSSRKSQSDSQSQSGSSDSDSSSSGSSNNSSQSQNSKRERRRKKSKGQSLKQKKQDKQKKKDKNKTNKKDKDHKKDKSKQRRQKTQKKRHSKSKQKQKKSDKHGNYKDENKDRRQKRSRTRSKGKDKQSKRHDNQYYSIDKKQTNIKKQARQNQKRNQRPQIKITKKRSSKSKSNDRNNKQKQRTHHPKDNNSKDNKPSKNIQKFDQQAKRKLRQQISLQIQKSKKPNTQSSVIQNSGDISIKVEQKIQVKQQKLQKSSTRLQQKQKQQKDSNNNRDNNSTNNKDKDKNVQLQSILNKKKIPIQERFIIDIDKSKTN